MRRRGVALRGLVVGSWMFTLAALLLASSAYAAEVTASLLGTVRDASGAVVTGANISLTNTQTNVAKKTESGTDGEYSFTLIPVGQYRLTVERTGFRKYVQEGIILQVNQAAKQDISLQVGAQTEVVEVTGDVAQVDTVTATLGSVETQRRIVDLPLVERDTFQLGLLQAGVFAPDPDDGSGNPFSVSGQRSESLTFLVNGVDNNDFLGNNAGVDPNPDAVAEFKILTNNYGAEYGRTSGGIGNQVIKSGTNAFHGGVFEFFRNDDLNARNYFQLERTRFNRNLFGGTLGGPIRKDKTFFFISYQGSRRIEGQVAPVLTVLSPAQRGCTTVAPGCVGTGGRFQRRPSRHSAGQSDRWHRLSQQSGSHQSHHRHSYHQAFAIAQRSGYEQFRCEPHRENSGRPGHRPARSPSHQSGYDLRKLDHRRSQGRVSVQNRQRSVQRWQRPDRLRLL